jgi:hypothetical protein
VKYAISRTSEWNDEEPPVPGAVREAYIRVDERTTNDPKKIPANKGTDGGWYETGRNHRVERRHIMRDFDAEGWFIEVPDLAALMALVKKHGHVIVKGEMFQSPYFPEIEIYDGYRE